MAAALTVSPSDVGVGDEVVVSGTGWLPSTSVTVSVPELGLTSELPTDLNGDFSGRDIADKAFGSLVSDGTVPTANDTVTIGAQTYTFVATPTTVAGQVKIGTGGSAVQDTLANLKAAVNLGAGSGTLYGSLTVLNTTVSAGAIITNELQLYAKTGGTAGNSIVLTESGTHTTIKGSAITLLLGAAATGVDPFIFVPEDTSPFTVSVTDGVSMVSTRKLVSSS